MRLLIAAEDNVDNPSQIPAGVRLLIEAATEIWVMTPSLVGPVQWLTGGIDEARQSADRRLEVILDHLAAEGKTASGIRGDELILTAIDDALRQFPADHIIVALRSSQTTSRRRRRGIDHLLDRHDNTPITLFTVHT